MIISMLFFILKRERSVKKKMTNPMYKNSFFFFFSHIKFYFAKFSQKLSLRKYFNIAYNPWRNKYWCKSFDWTRGTRNRYTNRTFFIYSCVSHECELTNVIFFSVDNLNFAVLLKCIINNICHRKENILEEGAKV